MCILRSLLQGTYSSLCDATRTEAKADRKAMYVNTFGWVKNENSVVYKIMVLRHNTTLLLVGGRLVNQSC